GGRHAEEQGKQHRGEYRDEPDIDARSHRFSCGLRRSAIAPRVVLGPAPGRNVHPVGDAEHQFAHQLVEQVGGDLGKLLGRLNIEAGELNLHVVGVVVLEIECEQADAVGAGDVAAVGKEEVAGDDALAGRSE